MFGDQVGYHIYLSVSGSIMNGSHFIIILKESIQVFVVYKIMFCLLRNNIITWACGST